MNPDIETTEITERELLEARLRKLNLELVKLREEKDHYKRQFEEILASKSWKLTAPLRGATSFKKALFPLLRTAKYRLLPVILRSLEQKAEEFTITGPTPALDLKLEGSEKFVSPGWYSFDASVLTPKGTLFFYLYLGRSEGFTENERYLLSFDNNEFTRQPIYISEGVNSLRLQVYDFDGSFELHNMRLSALGSVNLSWLLFRKYLWPLLKQPRALVLKMRKALHCFREGGLWALRAKVFGGRVTSNYNEWVARFDSFSESDKRLILEAAAKLKLKPKISIITPVYNPPVTHFRLCLDSVIGQAYENWELCLADDGSTNPEIKKIIAEYCSKDSRIKAIYREKSGHISQASNSAISLASGEYLSFLDHDDELTPDALYLVANEINHYPKAGLIYSDEDKKTSYGLRINPHFKSDWNPELLLQQNFICHFLTVKKELVEQVGGLRTEFDRVK